MFPNQHFGMARFGPSRPPRPQEWGWQAHRMQQHRHQANVWRQQQQQIAQFGRGSQGGFLGPRLQPMVRNEVPGMPQQARMQQPEERMRFRIEQEAQICQQAQQAHQQRFQHPGLRQPLQQQQAPQPVPQPQALPPSQPRPQVPVQPALQPVQAPQPVPQPPAQPAPQPVPQLAANKQQQTGPLAQAQPAPQPVPQPQPQQRVQPPQAQQQQQDQQQVRQPLLQAPSKPSQSQPQTQQNQTSTHQQQGQQPQGQQQRAPQQQGQPSDQQSKTQEPPRNQSNGQQQGQQQQMQPFIGPVQPPNFKKPNQPGKSPLQPTSKPMDNNSVRNRPGPSVQEQSSASEPLFQVGHLDPRNNFPPFVEDSKKKSKKKRRPGDWGCGMRGTFNYSYRKSYYQCNEEKGSGQEVDASQSRPSEQAPPTDCRGRPPREQGWHEVRPRPPELEQEDPFFNNSGNWSGQFNAGYPRDVRDNRDFGHPGRRHNYEGGLQLREGWPSSSTDNAYEILEREHYELMMKERQFEQLFMSWETSFMKWREANMRLINMDLEVQRRSEDLGGVRERILDKRDMMQQGRRIVQQGQQSQRDFADPSIRGFVDDHPSNTGFGDITQPEPSALMPHPRQEFEVVEQTQVSSNPAGRRQEVVERSSQRQPDPTADLFERRSQEKRDNRKVIDYCHPSTAKLAKVIDYGHTSTSAEKTGQISNKESDRYGGLDRNTLKRTRPAEPSHEAQNRGSSRDAVMTPGDSNLNRERITERRDQGSNLRSEKEPRYTYDRNDRESNLKRERNIEVGGDRERNFRVGKESKVNNEVNAQSECGRETLVRGGIASSHTVDRDLSFGPDIETNIRTDVTQNENNRHPRSNRPKLSLSGPSNDEITITHEERPSLPIIQGKTLPINDLLRAPGRFIRPPKIVIIFRGLPGSGKSHIAKSIKAIESLEGADVPRILALDEYFTVEGHYEYEGSMEEAYRSSLVKSFKKTCDDGLFTFIMVDCVNELNSHYMDMWSYAKQKGFEVYVAQLECDVEVAQTRNTHNRRPEDIERMAECFEVTPAHVNRLDLSNLLQDQAIREVRMQDAARSNEADTVQRHEEVLEAPVGPCKSKWEVMDNEEQLAKLDGFPRVRVTTNHDSVEEWLRLNTSQDKGGKRVRWADVEERRAQLRLRETGFVVGQDYWRRTGDPNRGRDALTDTRLIPNRLEQQLEK